MGVLRPDLMMKCIIPVVMAGIIAVSWGRWALEKDERVLKARANTVLMGCAIY